MTEEQYSAQLLSALESRAAVLRDDGKMVEASRLREYGVSLEAKDCPPSSSS